MPHIPRTIYFVRHGQTDWNAERRMQGQIDIPLNDIGRGQAGRNGVALAGRLAADGLSPHAIDYVASPLSRASETMAILRGKLGLAPDGYRTDPRLMEMGYGSWEGETWPRLKTSRPPEIEAWLADVWNLAPPGGESYSMVMDRVVACVSELERPVVVVAHGGVMRVLRGHHLKLAPGAMTRLDVPQDKVLVLRDGRESWL
jgi:broad specificity phosphatase PhoE